MSTDSSNEPPVEDTGDAEAADLLHASRPHLLKFMDNGELDFYRVGNRRRIRMDDLLDFIARRERAKATPADRQVGAVIARGHEPRPADATNRVAIDIPVDQELDADVVKTGRLLSSGPDELVLRQCAQHELRMAMARTPEAVVAVSRALRDDLVAEAPDVADRVRVIHTR